MTNFINCIAAFFKASWARICATYVAIVTFFKVTWALIRATYAIVVAFFKATWVVIRTTYTIAVAWFKAAKKRPNTTFASLIGGLVIATLLAIGSGINGTYLKGSLFESRSQLEIAHERNSEYVGEIAVLTKEREILQQYIATVEDERAAQIAVKDGWFKRTYRAMWSLVSFKKAKDSDV